LYAPALNLAGPLNCKLGFIIVYTLNNSPGALPLV